MRFYYKRGDEVFLLVENDYKCIYLSCDKQKDGGINLDTLPILYQRKFSRYKWNSGNPVLLYYCVDVVYDNGVDYIFKDDDSYVIGECFGTELTYENDNLNFIDEL